MSRVRVATLNLWGTRGEWPRRRVLLQDGFRTSAPDLVAFQEAIVTDRYDQVADILGPGFHVVHQREREPDGQGISIASRWPVRNLREIDLEVTSRTRDFACGTLLAEIAAPPPLAPLLFANHLPSWQPAFELERELQAVAAAREIEAEVIRRPQLHVVVAGDQDADPRAASIRF